MGNRTTARANHDLCRWVPPGVVTLPACCPAAVPLSLKLVVAPALPRWNRRTDRRKRAAARWCRALDQRQPETACAALNPPAPLPQRQQVLRLIVGNSWSVVIPKASQGAVRQEYAHRRHTASAPSQRIPAPLSRSTTRCTPTPPVRCLPPLGLMVRVSTRCN